MRLGYLIPEFPGQTHIFFWREAQALHRLGFEVEWYSTRRPLQPCRHRFAEKLAAQTLYVFPPKLTPTLRFLMRHPSFLFHGLTYLASLPDTHLTRKLQLTGLIFCAAYLCADMKAKGITHIHAHSCGDAAHLLAIASFAPGVSYSLSLHGDLPVYGTAHQAKFARARFVAVVTALLQLQVKEFCHLPQDRLPLIRMGVDTQRFVPKPQSPRTVFELITVARLVACKGHRFALEALAVLRREGFKLRYTIVGDGEFKAEIEADIQRLSLQNDVRMLGTASEEQVIAALQEADAFILPSVGFGEAAPVSVMEAMSCGLPVISSLIGGTPELITDGHDGFLVAQGDSSAIRRALLRLLQDEELRGLLGRQARETAVQKFASELFARRFAELLVPKDSL